MRGSKAAFVMALAVVAGLILGASPASAGCTPWPGDGDIMNRSDEALTIRDENGACGGVETAVLNSGVHSNTWFSDTDYYWDNVWFRAHTGARHAGGTSIKLSAHNLDCRDDKRGGMATSSGSTAIDRARSRLRG